MDKNLKIAITLSAYDKMSTVVNSAVNRVQGKMQSMRKGLDSFGNSAVIGGGIATAFFGSTIKAAEENEIAVARLSQVYKSMGQNVAQASAQSQEYANKLQSKIAVEDEDIMAVQAKLATFSKVSDETARMTGVMDRATAAAFDLGAAGFGEASQNAVMLGKALQDPARGAMALARAGALNKADLPIIKQIQATKGLKAAQEFVLKAVERQVKGVAEATAPASRKMAIAWSEVAETIGKALLPAVKRITTVIANLMPRIQAFIEKNPTLVKTLAAVSAAMLFVGTVSKILSVILATNPIVLAVMAIATIVFVIYKNWDGIKAWFKKLWDTVSGYFMKAWNWIKNMFLNYTPYGLVIKHWDKIKGFFLGLWDRVKQIFLKTWEWVKGLFFKYHPAGIIYKHWDEIVEYFTKIWEKVKNVFKNAWASIKGGIKSFFSGGSSDAQAVANAYEKSLNEVNRRTAATVGFDANSNVNVAGGLNGMAALKPAAVNNTSTIHYAPNVVLNGPATPQDAANFISMTKTDAVNIMRDAERKKARVAF